MFYHHWHWTVSHKSQVQEKHTNSLPQIMLSGMTFKTHGKVTWSKHGQFLPLQFLFVFFFFSRYNGRKLLGCASHMAAKAYHSPVWLNIVNLFVNIIPNSLLRTACAHAVTFTTWAQLTLFHDTF